MNLEQNAAVSWYFCKLDKMVCVSRRGIETPHFMIWHPLSVEVVVHASVHCITAVKLIIFVLVLSRKENLVTILTSILHTSLKSKLWKACLEASLNTKASTWLDWWKFNSSWIVLSHKNKSQAEKILSIAPISTRATDPFSRQTFQVLLG